MPINYCCPHCGRQTNVDEQYAGSSGPCAGCGQTITIPGGKEPPFREPKPHGFAPTAPLPQKTGMPTWAILLIVGGVAFVMIGGMAALLLPAVQAAREAGNRASCKRNLRELTLAIQNYQDQRGELPPRYIPDEIGRPMHSWRVLILPYLGDAEADRLYRQYDFSEPWDGPNNRRLHDQMPRVFACPTSPTDKRHTSYMVVAGDNTPLQPAVPRRQRFGGLGPAAPPYDRWQSRTSFATVIDGTTKTACVVEVAGSEVIWLEPNDLAFDDAIRGVNVSREGDAVSSWHPQVAQVATLDRSVKVLRETDPPDLLERLLDCRDGRPIELGELER